MIENFKRRPISLWLLDLGNDCSGYGISELIVTILAAVAQVGHARPLRRGPCPPRRPVSRPRPRGRAASRCGGARRDHREAVLSLIDFERGLISERIKDAKRAARRDGLHLGGTRQFGYDIADGKLVPNEREQAASCGIAGEYLIMPLRERELLCLAIIEYLRKGPRPAWEIEEELAEEFHVTECERAELHPNINMPVWTNDVAWALSQLVQDRQILREPGKRKAPNGGRRGVYYLPPIPP